MTRDFSIFSGWMLMLVGVGVFALPIPAQAGFEWVAPGSSSGAADAGTDMPAYAPAPVEALPAMIERPTVDLPVMPPPPASAIAPVATPVPVYTGNSAPLVITSRPSDRPAQTQERKTAVYPPPGNAPAAPLSGSRVVMPTKSFATAPATPVVTSAQSSPSSSVINWNNQGISRVEPVTAAPVDAGVVAPIRNVPVPAAPVPDSFAVLSGFGSDIPFDLALDQVVPKDYRVIYQDRPERSMLVSWSGGRTWDAVLDDMLAAHGYRAAISGRTVTIARDGGKLSQAAGAAADVVPSAGAALADPMLPPVPPQGALSDVALVPDLPDETPVTHAFDGGKKDRFRASAGDDLQDVLTAWSNRAGVKLYWQADQAYTLQDDIALDTTYPRAVDTLLKSFRDDPARPVASLHPNAPKGPAVLSVAVQDSF